MSLHKREKIKGLLSVKMNSLVDQLLLAEITSGKKSNSPGGNFYRAVRQLAQRNPDFRLFVGLPLKAHGPPSQADYDKSIPERSLFGYVTQRLPEVQGGGDKWRDQLAKDAVREWDLQVRREHRARKRREARQRAFVERTVEAARRRAQGLLPGSAAIYRAPLKPGGRRTTSPVGQKLVAARQAAALARARQLVVDTQAGVAAPPAPHVPTPGDREDR